MKSYDGLTIAFHIIYTTNFKLSAFLSTLPVVLIHIDHG